MPLTSCIPFESLKKSFPHRIIIFLVLIETLFALRRKRKLLRIDLDEDGPLRKEYLPKCHHSLCHPPVYCLGQTSAAFSKGPYLASAAQSRKVKTLLVLCTNSPIVAGQKASNRNNKPPMKPTSQSRNSQLLSQLITQHSRSHFLHHK